MREMFSRFARGVSALAGHPAAFVLAVLAVLGWAALGPRLHYSENWQLWINTGTTILTFLMVFLLQHSQNRDARAVQLKLDELLRALNGARNELIDLENLSEADLAKYCREFQALHLRYAKALERKGGPLPVKAARAAVPAPRKKAA
ncbi:MAG TPA: low affinity iron permease family protein [Opitutaceae bacterium]|nr:low affinity iron permease family protein [Opitutaceae bacterium]